MNTFAHQESVLPDETEFTQRAREYASRCHAEVNHWYDGDPYAKHLQLVVAYAHKYRLKAPMNMDKIYAACWCHDVIEDARQTYNDVKEVCGFDVAEIVYAVTNEKGRTRADRANDKYYEGIRNTEGAVFVKLCDRLANVYYNVVGKDAKMLQKYRQEYPHFKASLRRMVSCQRLA